jgi:hypothetical protein
MSTVSSVSDVSATVCSDVMSVRYLVPFSMLPWRPWVDVHLNDDERLQGIVVYDSDSDAGVLYLTLP